MRGRFKLLIFGIGVATAVSVWAAEIRGRVLSMDGRPVARAEVREIGGSASAATDDAGEFVLSSSSAGRLRLRISHPSFLDEEIVVPDAERAQPMIIRLAPLIRQAEDVVVTALRYPETQTHVPAAATVVPGQMLEESLAPNIVEALAGVAGLAPLGSGGFSLVPSIRGLARNRILLLIDDSRVTSDRRTGPGASFVGPEDLQRIEVLRSPSSVFYGSDAMGGVVQMVTKEPPPEDGIHGRLHLGLGTVNGEARHGLSLAGRRGAWGFYLSTRTESAGDYRSPESDVLQSRYSQAGLFGKISHRVAARDIELSFLSGRGTDIGKPAKTSAAKPTWYPRENQNLVQLRWREKAALGGEWTFHAFVNPNFLETRTQTLSAEGSVAKDSRSRTESTELGAQLSYARKLGASLRLTGGLDYFGRAGAAALLREESFDAAGTLTHSYDETSYDRGRRSDFGVYMSADYTGVKGLDLVGGLRWDAILQSAHPGGGETMSESRRSAVTGFLAASYKLTPQLLAFANASSAFRTPGLGELFYTGITGRGMIIAQPGLTPERSLNWDVGMKWFSERLYAGAYAFVYTIDGWIDRFLVSPQVYTYGNLDKARLKGVELEAEFCPLSSWRVFGSFAVLGGRSVATGAVVNDVPPLRLTLGTRVSIRRFSAELTALIQGRKSEPGPAEIAIDPYQVFSLKASYFVHPVQFFVVAGNLFNATYIGRPDPDAMPEPGRGLVLGISAGF